MEERNDINQWGEEAQEKADFSRELIDEEHMLLDFEKARAVTEEFLHYLFKQGLVREGLNFEKILDHFFFDNIKHRSPTTGTTTSEEASELLFQGAKNQGVRR